MKKKYNLEKKEKKIYKTWEKKGFFKPNYFTKNLNRFSIIMPPPNITGSLHIGHAFQQTIMDIIVRYNRMLGKKTIWLMGTDHAGISTQIIVENNIYKKEKNKKIKNNELKKKIWLWKKKYEKKIYKQTKLLGSSVNWDITRFSLDKNFSYSVKKAFILLYNKKLIYKSKKIIYWDKKHKKVLSDLEINKIKKISCNWFIKYKILTKSKIKYIIISTSKPETILGDTALAVNPKDERYSKIINEYAINPINNNYIKIISDNSINPNKGYGCIRITPAHNFKNFDIAKKHKLNMINIFNKKGFIRYKSEIFNYKGKKIKNKINLYNPNWIVNLSSKEAKIKVINFLKKKKLIKKIEKHHKKIFLNKRTNSIIEPFLTDQWYLKTKKLSKKSIKIIKNKKIIFYPSKYKKLYYSWMKNQKDWCISRQIIWGHKIPIWYDIKKNIYLGYNKKYIIKKYKIKKNTILIQDKNILDTWFSSSLWSFASLGWPQNKKKLKKFHPLNLVVSGFDIIYFWISRMIMMTLTLIKKKKIPQIPFKKIFITGLIKDENGKKMSKSIGNVINPIDIIKGITLKKLINKRKKKIINKENLKKIINNTKKQFPNGIKPHGTDSLRFMLASIINKNLSINLDFKKLNNSYNLCNKLWNACRYTLIKIKKYKEIKINTKIKNINKISLIDQWILNKLNILIFNYTQKIKKLRIDLLCNYIYKFIKHELCDWYLEFLKLINNNKNIILFKIIKNILKISHPIIPFITEYFWQKIIKYDHYICDKNSYIIVEKFPLYKNIKYNREIYIISIIKKIISYLRKLKINFKSKIDLMVTNTTKTTKKNLNKNKYLFKILNINNIIIHDNKYIILKEKNFSKPYNITYKIFISYKIY